MSGSRLPVDASNVNVDPIPHVMVFGQSQTITMENIKSVGLAINDGLAMDVNTKHVTIRCGDYTVTHLWADLLRRL